MSVTASLSSGRSADDDTFVRTIAVGISRLSRMTRWFSVSPFAASADWLVTKIRHPRMPNICECFEVIPVMPAAVNNRRTWLARESSLRDTEPHEQR